MNNGTDIEYDFQPPPETMVFEPTKEEFKDALAYIEKIRPIAEQYDTVRVKPPEVRIFQPGCTIFKGRVLTKNKISTSPNILNLQT